MALYKDFAQIYQRGWYANFSLNIAEGIPALFDYLRCKPKTILDLACGEGSFAIEMAKQGFEVIGVDISTRMLSLAKQKSKLEKVKVEWLHQDMLQLNLAKQVDLCTCWFDSLNYILDWNQLQQVFERVYQILNPYGYFIFDMNTRYGLIQNWNRFPCYAPQDTETCFEVHQPSFDYEQEIASVKITGFLKEGKLWKRIREIHKEKAYSIEEIQKAFSGAGFKETYCFSNLQDRSPIDEESGRVFFILQNQSIV